MLNREDSLINEKLWHAEILLRQQEKWRMIEFSAMAALTVKRGGNKCAVIRRDVTMER